MSFATLQRPCLNRTVPETQQRNTKAQSDEWLNQWLATASTTALSSATAFSPDVRSTPAGTEESKEQLKTTDVSLLSSASSTEGKLDCNLAVDRLFSSLNEKHISAKGRIQAMTTLCSLTQCPLPNEKPNCDSANTNASPSRSLIDRFVQLHLRCLLRQFLDANEKCRSLSIALCHSYLSRCSLPTFETALALLIPLLTTRMNVRDLTSAAEPASASNPVLSFPFDHAKCAGGGVVCEAEPSEEVRSELLQLTALVVERCQRSEDMDERDCDVLSEAAAADELQFDAFEVDDSMSRADVSFYLTEIVTILAQGVTDRSPDIKLQSSALLIQLMNARPTQLRNSALVIARLLLPNLFHKQHRVRSATIKALQYVVPNGAAEILRDLTAFREANVIDIHGFYHGEVRHNHFARLVIDAHPCVRAALYAALDDWLLNMPEQADYETLMMPYLLSGLHDEVENNSCMCMRTLDRLGQRYEQDFADQLRDEIKYANILNTQGPRAAIAAEPFLTISGFPYQNRPQIGVRHLMRRFVDRLIGAIVLELSDWQQTVQLHSILLLRSLLYLTEEKSSIHLHDLVNAALRLVARIHFGTSDTTVAKDVREEMRIAGALDDVLRLMGRYLDTVLLLEYLQLRTDHNTAPAVLHVMTMCLITAPTLLVTYPKRKKVEDLQNKIVLHCS